MFSTLSLGGATRTAWIFGAGASRCPPYKVPTQMGLLKRFEKQPVAGKTEALRQAFLDARARVPGWVQRVQPGRHWLDPEISLEEVFSYYELVLAEPEHHTAEGLADARQALDDLLLALRAATSVFGGHNAFKYRPFERKAGDSAPYAELVEQILTRAGTQQQIGRAHV